MTRLQRFEKGTQILREHGFTTQVRTVTINTKGMDVTHFETISVYAQSGQVYYQVGGVGLFQDIRFVN